MLLRKDVTHVTVVFTMEDITKGQGVRNTLLIVDSSEFRRKLVSSICEPTYQLLLSNTVDEAASILQGPGRNVDALLVEGALLSAMKGRSGDCVLIALSERSEDEFDALSQGAQDFIVFPSDPRLVRLKIERAIRQGCENRLFRLSEHDHLTGVYTREVFFPYAEKLMKANPGLSYDALVLNIDHFRMFRDLYGPEVSDNMLRILASLVKVRFSKMGGIVGGGKPDCFLVLVPHQEDWPQLLRQVLEPLRQMRDLPQVQVRSGIYAPIGHELPVATAFERANFACDRARENFNKPYCFFDSDLHKAQMEEMRLVGDTPRAIEERQFVIRYQPKFRISDRALVGAEALVRWNHPRLGFLTPDRFIPLFERNGLISALDNYIWNCVASQIRSWKESLGSCVPISTNISRVDVGMPDLVGTIHSIVEHYGLEPRDLNLEVTESAYTREPSRLVQLVSQLRSLGYRIEMDDFGSGCSSLNMLALLPIDVLKLDMQFLQLETERPAIIRDVLHIANDMRVPVIAEGVESETQAKMLEELGCQYAQGFHYGRPMTAEQFFALMSGQKQATSIA